MYNLDTIQGLKTFIEELTTFINSSPPVSIEMMDDCDLYLSELRNYHATISTALGKAETLFAREVHQVVKTTDKDTYNRVKNSSTILTKFVEGKNPVLTEVLHQLRSFEKVINSTASQFTTLISYRKEEMKLHNIRKPNNSEFEFKM